MQKAQQAKQETDAANELEEIKLAVVSAMVNGTDGKVSAENLKTALTGIIDNTSGITGNGPTWTVTGKSGAYYKIYSSGQVEKQTSQSISNVVPGIYDENDQIVWTWDELLGLELGFWKVDDNGALVKDATNVMNAIANGTMTQEEAMQFLMGCMTRIKKVVIPDNVTSIGDEVFAGCQNLSSIEIPSSVMSIGTYAFNSCHSLSSIEIPSSVTSISNNAFDDCTNLRRIIIHKNHDSIPGALWGAPNGISQVIWDDNVTQMEI